MKPVAELYRIELPLGTMPASDHDTGRGHPRQSCETDEFPRHPHRRVAYGS
jgi:hypothetical protein